MRAAFLCKRFVIPAVVLVGGFYYVISAGWTHDAFLAGAFSSADNATLGFEQIIFVNLPYRKDYSNIMSIQSHLSNMKYVVSEGADVHDFKSNDKGRLRLLIKICHLLS